MEKKKFPLSQNSILALLMVIALFVFAALSFDFYYDLNDDVMIKDILSGAYTGTPDGHCIQMLYPISFLISMCYRLIPAMPWQGIFLCVCQGVCFYIVAKRSISLIEKKWKKVLLLLAEVLMILSLFLWETVIVQYTITAAMLVAAACFLVLTLPLQSDCDIKEFLTQQMPAIILVVLAFNVRSEMMLLMSPFVAFSGILKWSGEAKAFAAQTIKKYLSLVGLIVAGMIISFVVDYMAYGSAQWKEFRDFFNARTQVYDYTWYPDYEEAEAFYLEEGVDRAEYALLDNYNFGLDEAIDAKLLWSIAEYADENTVELPLGNRIKEAFSTYKWRTLHEDIPYSYMVILAYLLVVALAIGNKESSIVWKVILLAVFRTIPWMYVILANRVPNRISHPLYFIELVILGAWITDYCRRSTKGVKWIGWVCAGILLCCACIHLPDSYKNVCQEMEHRETVNEVMREFSAYAMSNPQNYYYLDVYSTVSFSEKMFKDVDNSQKNYDLPGGWVSGSPLQKRVTLPYHNELLSEAELLLKDNFFFVIEKERSIGFLDDYYGTQGITLQTEVIEEIGNNANPLQVYQVLPAGY